MSGKDNNKYVEISCYSAKLEEILQAIKNSKVKKFAELAGKKKTKELEINDLHEIVSKIQKKHEIEFDETVEYLAKGIFYKENDDIPYYNIRKLDEQVSNKLNTGQMSNKLAYI